MRVRLDCDTRGFIDCDGGSNAEAELEIDSHGGGARVAIPQCGSGGWRLGAGAAVAYVVIESGTTTEDATPCEDAVYQAPIRTAVTTGVAHVAIPVLGVQGVAQILRFNDD